MILCRLKFVEVLAGRQSDSPGVSETNSGGELLEQVSWASHVESVLRKGQTCLQSAFCSLAVMRGPLGPQSGLDAEVPHLCICLLCPLEGEQDYPVAAAPLCLLADELASSVSFRTGSD